MARSFRPCRCRSTACRTRPRYGEPGAMGSARSRLVIAVALVTFAGGAAAWPAAARVPHATFSPPLILGGGGAEPSIRVAHDGKAVAYVSAPTGLGSNFWRITMRHNPDGSVTF